MLKEARRLLLEYGWTDGRFARNRYGHEVAWYSRNAVKFCAVGAVNRACYNLNKATVTSQEVQNLLEWKLGTKDIIAFNDTYRYEHSTSDKRMRRKYEVIAYFDQTISLLEKEIKAKKKGYTEKKIKERSVV